MEAAIALIIRQTNKPKFPVGYQREILVVTNRRYNTITLPGGKLDPGEGPIDAVLREIQEEVNLTASAADLNLIGSSLSANVQGVADDVFVHFYYARKVIGAPCTVEGGTDVFWCGWEELIQRSFFAPFYKKHLPAGIEHYPRTIFQGSSL